MRSRVHLFALLIVACSLALPLAAHAGGIPFFGPIIEKAWMQCPLGWGALITVINNIISLLITLAIVFVAPLMIAWAGFLLVVSQGDSGKRTEARKILTNTIFGIVIALAGWMIVDAIMAVLYNANAPTKDGVLGTWSDLIGSRGIPPCIDLRGSVKPTVVPPPTVGVVPSACSVTALSAITDPLAQQMESGQTRVVWTNTDPRLQICFNKFKSKMPSAYVTSAYRPQSYQNHFLEIRDRWCTQGLQSNTNPTCSSVKSVVAAEVAKHFGTGWACGAVGEASRHTSGTGIDIGGVFHADGVVRIAASQACLQWKNHPGDPYHYDLKTSCACN